MPCRHSGDGFNRDPASLAHDNRNYSWPINEVTIVALSILTKGTRPTNSVSMSASVNK